MKVRQFEILIMLLFLMACSSDLDNAQDMVDASIAAHRGEVFMNSKVSFEFRDREYSVSRTEDYFVYTRSFQDSAGFVEDVLINSLDFSRRVDGYDVVLSDMWKTRYGNSVNSVLYFFELPTRLNDPAVRKSYIGDVIIKGEPYYSVKVTFREEDGGKDFQDEFRYWIHKQNHMMDYVAYNYITDGGGTRFRQAINRREVSGLIVQDYINFKPDEKFEPLDNLPGLFESDSLTELSRIVNTNVKVEPI